MNRWFAWVSGLLRGPGLVCFGLGVGLGLGGSWLFLVSSGSSFPGLSWFKLVRAGSGCFKLVRAGSSWFKLVQAGSSWFELGRAGSSWFELVAGAV